MKTKVEIRECAWIGGRAVKWQGHAYVDGHRFSEPLISGMPERTKDKAKAALWIAIAGYKEVIKGAEDASRREDEQREERAMRKAKAKQKELDGKTDEHGKEQQEKPAETGKKTIKTKKEK